MRLTRLAARQDRQPAKSWRAPAVVGLTLLAAACTPQASTTQGPDIKVGVPLATTGAAAQEAMLARQGYELWRDWANRDGGVEIQGVRHRVRLQYQNDNSDPQMSARVAEELITGQKVSFLLGPYSSANTAAAAAVADKAHVPLVASTATAREIFTQGYHYVFGVLASTNLYPQTLIDMVLSLNPRPQTIGILAADDVFSQGAANAVVDYAKTGGMQVVFSQTYPTGLTNFDSLVLRAKAANPDILFNLGHLLESVGVSKASMDLQMNAKLFAFSTGPGEPEYTGALGKAADYVTTVLPWSAESRFKASYYLSTPQYVAAYRKKYHTDQEPSFPVADATAAGVALQAAIEHAHSLDRDKVRKALAALDVFTFFGRINFDAQGQVSVAPGFRPGVVIQIQNGRPATVWPQQAASASLVYPTPTWAERLGLAAAPPMAPLPGTGLPSTSG